MAKKKEKKKPIFEKVGLVFRSPVRADILRELSESPQRPTEIAENIGLQKQNINYHLNALKRGGLVKTHKKELTETEIPKGKGTRINGISKSGKLKVAQGVELTKNGKNIVNQFISPLYEDMVKEKERIKKIIKNDKMEDE
ncbi:MAG: helix-turn-helix transcriptional regulator [Promethearchaeota archaeon]|nr:MAG: helix-turn-helix transcriptional regulator [Candidatus Lokiarchaeota archaeon]